MTARKRRWLVILPLGLVGACLLAVGIAALSNVGLPRRSPHPETLGVEQEYLLAEATHLRQELGGTIWSGWDEADIPLIAYNEQYAFLVGYPRPPAGWVKVPDQRLRGAAWELVPGETYYQQAVAHADREIGAFTVRVGERMAAAFGTWDWARIGLVQGMRGDIPRPLNALVPYRVVIWLLMGDHARYIAAYEHESFHAFQAMVAPDRLTQAEQVASLEEQYPFDDPAAKQAFAAEVDLLYQALKAESDDQARSLVQQWWAQRTARRQGLSAELAGYERQREWLEGLAKYTEQAIGLAAAQPGYQPLATGDVHFDGYASYARFYSAQIDEVRRMDAHDGEVRFYYTGMAQALLLDRLLPGWKDQIWAEGAWLEDLLVQAAAGA